jgi:hypothetical protein
MHLTTDKNIFERIFNVNSNFIIDVWCGEHIMDTKNPDIRSKLCQILSERDLAKRHLLAAKFADLDEDYIRACFWVRLPETQFTPG